MIIGFTGTRKGLTKDQYAALKHLLEVASPHIEIAHYGDAVGADFEFFVLMRHTNRETVLHSHPSDMADQRAWTKADRGEAPRPPLKRNADIATSIDLLIACPAENAEIIRSGTWMTVRTARSHDVPVLLVLPSGEICTRPARHSLFRLFKFRVRKVQPSCV